MYGVKILNSELLILAEPKCSSWWQHEILQHAKLNMKNMTRDVSYSYSWDKTKPPNYCSVTPHRFQRVPAWEVHAGTK